MSVRTVNSFWSARFEDRLEELPDDIEALFAELADAKCAYEGFAVALQARLETLRLNVKQASVMTTTVLSLPAEIYLNICAVLAEIDPLGEVIEYNDCASSIEEHGADDASDLYEADDISYVDSETSDIRLSPGLGWGRVTHVSALWRRRAIENATLWTTIPLNLCMPWLCELIKRSSNLPLDIIVPCDAEPDIACRVLEDTIHRARSITMAVHTIAGISELILARARLLERLEVNNDYGEYWTLPPDLLMSLPRLKTISITSAAEIPKLAAASQITHLAILSVSSAPSRENLRDMLQSLINVQYLQLEDCLAPACFEGFLSEPISLPVLETLILRGPTGSCGDVIRSISPPSSASLALYLLPDPLWPDAVNRQYDEDGEPVYDVSLYMRCSGLNQLYNRLGDSTYHALRISCTTPDYWTRTSSRKVYWQLVVTAHRDAGAQLDEYDPDSLQQYGQWSGPSFADMKVVCTLPPIPQHDGSVYVYNTAFPMGVFERTVEALPLASLTVLSLNIDALALAAERSYSGSWNQMAWFSILAGLDRLKCLQLISSFNKVNENWPTSSYVGLLSALSIADDEGVHRPIPHLETLHLLDVFANASGQVEGEDNHPIHMSAAQALRQFVKSRRWKAETIHVEYTSAAWQYRYFNPLGGPLKSAKPVRLGLSHDWQLEGLDASVSD